MSTSRYTNFVNDKLYMTKIPFIKIPVTPTDYYITYEVGKTRLDTISYEYYGDANYGWLILQANPHLGALEYLIPNNSTIRVPYPLHSALSFYESNIKKYNSYYGLDN